MKSSHQLASVLGKQLSHVCSDSLRLNVLDVGGASGRIWQDLLCPCIHLTIVDPFDPGQLAVDLANERILSEFQKCLPLMANDSFDIVVAIDLIEHLPLHEGYLLLYSMERLARKAVIIYTPNGFVWQPPSENNEFNAHVSGWSVGDFRRFGFKKFVGHVNLKLLVGPYAEPRFPVSSLIFQALWMLGLVLSKVMPVSAFAISAVLSKGSRSAINQAV